MLVWVVGIGGMLGSAIAAEAAAGGADLFDADPVPWHDPRAAALTLATDAARFHRAAGQAPWAVIWAAGSAVVATDDDATRQELETLSTLLDALAEAPPPGPGAFFLTSSAGGVYAGSADPPFGADTEPAPISPYGRLKLAQEQVARTALDGRIPVVLGRFSNLYGTRHNLSKGQGLIPLLCRATLKREPLNLYVSMDTVRDYLLVEDAARMAWAAIGAAVRDENPVPQTVVIASGQPATVADVIGTVQNVAHRRVPLALGTHASAARQTIDLRLTPSPELAHIDRTPLPSGIKRVYTAMAGRPG